MTIDEWSAQIFGELAAAGFSVSMYEGFPLVKRPDSIADTTRLLKFKNSMSTERTIYAEGMLFVPAGSAQLLQKHLVNYRAALLEKSKVMEGQGTEPDG